MDQLPARFRASRDRVLSWIRKPARAKDRRRPSRRPSLECFEPRQLLSTISEFPAPGGSSLSDLITTGSDGNLWFTENAVNKIGMINPTTHVSTDFAVPGNAGEPFGITNGPDGNIWFIDNELGRADIGMINPTTDVISVFPTPAYSIPIAITSGPDGNLWFTDFSNNSIGMMNPATHVVSEFAIPSYVFNGVEDTSFPSGITAGPDGNIWFTEIATGKIGMINPTTDVISEFTLPANSQPTAIAAGPDGNIWFTEPSLGEIGRINPTTDAITQIPLGTTWSFPAQITAAPDGNVYFTEFNNSRIGMINPVTLAVTETTTPTLQSSPFGITAGPDGNIWFTEGVGQIGVLTPTLVAPLNVVQTPAITAAKALFSGRGTQRHLVGFELDFSGPMHATSAAKYVLTKSVRKGERVIAQPVNVKIVYHASKHHVDLILKHATTFSARERFVVSGQLQSSVTDISADLTFAVGRRGATISL